jgi:inosose dehydratase
MATTTTPRFGIDLFAYWHPSVWGVDDLSEISALGTTDPTALWTRLLDLVEASGVTAIEITFAPFDWRTATAAFGSVDGFLRELDGRGLSICGGYLPSLEAESVWTPEGRAALVEETAAYSHFLASVGATALIGSAPKRTTRGSEPARFSDLGSAQSLGDLFNVLGAIAYREGISFGLHTESHSMMWLSRDIDLFMLATDPFSVGLCPDAGHITLGGGDPVAVAERHLDRLVSAHWKDAVGPMSWNVPIDASVHAGHRELCRVPGQGIVDWSAWAAVMARAGLTDPVLIEADASGEPVSGIRSAVAHLTPLVEATHRPVG